MTAFNERLKEAIKSSGLTRDQFAASCEVSRSQLYRYLKGDQKPGAFFLQKLRQEFPKIDINWLLAGIEQLSDSEAWLDLDSNESPNRDLLHFLQNKDIPFETQIAELLIFQAMKETKHVLEDNEREHLAQYIGKHKISKIFESIQEHLLILKGVDS